LKERANQIEYYIDNCEFIDYAPNFKFILALFEKNQAKVFDAKTFKVIQEIKYKSNYGEPKNRPLSNQRSSKGNSKE